jgi:FG-GAP-like repeat
MKALRQFCIVFSICFPLAGCALDVSGWGRRHTEWAVSVAKNRNSFGGTSEWKVINTSNIPVYQILLGDFDGDGKADVFTTWDGKWRISVANDSNSLGGTSNWKVINTSDVLLSDIRLSDFDGDGKADVFTALDGKWLVSLGGTSKWKAINTSWVYPPEIRLGDFDGDGKTDVFTTWGGKWRVSVANDSNSLGGTSEWKEINTSNVLLSDILLADFDGPRFRRSCEDRRIHNTIKTGSLPKRERIPCDRAVRDLG